MFFFFFKDLFFPLFFSVLNTPFIVFNGSEGVWILRRVYL